MRAPLRWLWTRTRDTMGGCVAIAVVVGPVALAVWAVRAGLVTLAVAALAAVVLATVLVAVAAVIYLRLQGTPFRDIPAALWGVLVMWGGLLGMLVLVFLPGLLVLGAFAWLLLVVPVAVLLVSFSWIRRRMGARQRPGGTGPG